MATYLKKTDMFYKWSARVDHICFQLGGDKFSG